MRRKITQAAALAAVALGLAGTSLPAHAISGLSEATGGTRKGAVTTQRFRALTVLVSPYTSFQRNFAAPGDGVVYQRKTTSPGPLVLLEKVYRLDQRDTFLEARARKREGSTFTLGGYYWYNSSRDDRLTVYGKYFPNAQFGGELDLGGETHTGVTEYYGFLLYNALRVTDRNNLAVQLGIGPYVPRASAGKLGYTGQVTAAYRIAPYTTAVASLWYVDFNSSFPQYGFSKTNTTARVSLGVGYNF